MSWQNLLRPLLCEQVDMSLAKPKGFGKTQSEAQSTRKSYLQ